jgi:hypothetical protein
VGSTDPKTQAGATNEPGWGDCPPGHISLPEASRRAGVSSEWLRRLALDGRVDSVKTQIGQRTRTWLAEEQVSELAQHEHSQGFRSQPSGRRPDGRAPSGDGAEHDPIADERDRWRAEALKEADQHRAAAVDHIRAATDSLSEVLEKTREAVDHQNQALREFMIPADMLEN